MKSQWKLFVSVFQIVVGVLAIASFIILLPHNENILRWIVTLALSIAFVVMGIMGIIDYNAKR